MGTARIVGPPQGHPLIGTVDRTVERSILAAAGDLDAIAAAVVDQARRLTGAMWSSMLQMRGGRWVRLAACGGTDRTIAVALAPDDVPAGPMLVADAADDPHPLSAIARMIGIPAFAVVPLHLWPGGPALLTLSAARIGDVTEADVDTLSRLAIVAGAAAYRTPLEPSRAWRALDQLGWHQEMLESIARGGPLGDALRRVCLEVESLYDGARCSVLLVDPCAAVLHHVAAPSLPPSFWSAIDGIAVADGCGACGTAAATGAPVVVHDVLTDPRTSAFLQVAVRHDLRSVWSYPLLDSKGQVVGTFAVYRNRTHHPDADEIAGVASMASIAALAIERSRDEEALTRAALVDPLTGLPNRAQFARTLRLALERARDTATRCAVVFLDLDGFKFINDGLGHSAGDVILQEVAGRLLQAVGGQGVLARFGGDEFTVLVERASTDKVEALADALAAALEDPVGVDDGEFVLTTAIGIALSDGQDADPDTIVRDADAAMYAAKARGRGQRSLFDQPMRQRAVARMRLEGQLRRAVRAGAIRVDYQPILDIPTGRWCAAEALARWTTDDLVEVPPDRFIPLAEEVGLVGRLGQDVLGQVLRQITDDSAGPVDVPVAINVSPLQLADPGFVDDTVGLLHRLDVRPDRISLEITESALMANPELARRLLIELQVEGITTVIDDFGTGYSSIARLRDLPAAGIKIDKSFTAALTNDATSAAVVAAVVQLAHAFGLVVTAEGVESRDELRILGELGCDRAQGFLLARPAPADTFVRTLAEPAPQ